MKVLNIFGITLFTLTFSCFICPQESYAYLDPGTGSYILQITMAALLAGLFSMKLFFNKFKALLKNLFSKNNKCEDVKD